MSWSDNTMKIKSHFFSIVEIINDWAINKRLNGIKIMSTWRTLRKTPRHVTVLLIDVPQREALESPNLSSG